MSRARRFDREQPSLVDWEWWLLILQSILFATRTCLFGRMTGENQELTCIFYVCRVKHTLSSW